MYKGTINSVEYTLVKSNSTSTTVEESIDTTLSSAVALVLYKMLRVMNKQSITSTAQTYSIVFLVNINQQQKMSTCNRKSRQFDAWFMRCYHYFPRQIFNKYICKSCKLAAPNYAAAIWVFLGILWVVVILL